MQVSVICPVFNSDPLLLSAAVRTVLDQAGSHEIELILVDDGSTNQETRKSLAAISDGDRRVKVLLQQENGGPGQARTAGISSANFNWIGFIDSDDLWPPNKLQKAGEALQKAPDTRWIGGRHNILSIDGLQHTSPPLTEICKSSQSLNASSCKLSKPDLTKALINRMPPLGASLLRKDLFVAAGGFDPRLRYGEDWLLYLRLSNMEDLEFFEETTYILRRQRSSMMWSSGRMSAQFALSARLARRDPALRHIKPELRWFHYNNYKDIAMNNALNGKKIKGLLFALHALSVDPREIKDLLIYAGALVSKDKTLSEKLKYYSSANQVILADISGTS